jgi:hypothetical protein
MVYVGDYVGATAARLHPDSWDGERTKHPPLPTAIGKTQRIFHGSCIFFLTAWIGLLYSIVRFY